MRVSGSRIAIVVVLASIGILACAEGSKEDPSTATLTAAPSGEGSKEEEIKVPPPAPPAAKNDDKSSSGSSGTSGSSSGSSGSSSGSSGSSSGSSGTSGSSSGSSGTSTSSSSSGGAGADCDPNDLTYYLKAISELSGPSPQDCPCGSGTCCYGGLVCVPL